VHIISQTHNPFFQQSVAGAGKPGALPIPVQKPITTAPAVGSVANKHSALKDISVNVAMNSNNGAQGGTTSSGVVKPGKWRMQAEVNKPGASAAEPSSALKSAPSGMKQGDGVAAVAKLDHADSYEISDREDSSDDDYDSDGSRRTAKKVPDWAKGAALREVRPNG